jgi:hypothetical protein
MSWPKIEDYPLGTQDALKLAFAENLCKGIKSIIHEIENDLENDLFKESCALHNTVAGYLLALKAIVATSGVS